MDFSAGSVERNGIRFTYHIITTPTAYGTDVRAYVQSPGSTDRQSMAAWGGAAGMIGVALCDYYGLPRHRSVAFEGTPGVDLVVRLTAPSRRDERPLCVMLHERFLA